MPWNVSSHPTEGERAALTVVALEVKQHGLCDLSIAEIAVRAGCCRTTVQRAVAAAVEARLLSKTLRTAGFRRSHTNVLHIVSREWLCWIKRSRNRIGSQSSTPPPPAEAASTPSAQVLIPSRILHGVDISASKVPKSEHVIEYSDEKLKLETVHQNELEEFRRRNELVRISRWNE
jgi:hypothetical protein